MDFQKTQKTQKKKKKKKKIIWKIFLKNHE